MATNWSGREQAAQRLAMVNGQLRTCDVTDVSVLTAFLDVPRERFVAPSLAKLAYLDRDAPACNSKTRLLLAPRTLARLLQAAELTRGDRALDVGGGSGYSAALLQQLGASVVAVESDRPAAQFARQALVGYVGVEIIDGDLAEGAPGKGPFDVILVNGAFEKTPDALLAQLTAGGRLVGVDARDGAPHGVLIEKLAAGFSERSLFDGAAPLLDAFRRAPRFVF